MLRYQSKHDIPIKGGARFDQRNAGHAAERSGQLPVAVEEHRTEESMPTEPTIARIWRGRTRPEIADAYESYIRAEGIPPLEKTALGVQLFREDREQESWFTTISYWSDLESMTAFTKGEPTKVHHLDRDPEFLIELPEFIQIHRILINRQGLR
jgi:hypothetical protein